MFIQLHARMSAHPCVYLSGYLRVPGLSVRLFQRARPGFTSTIRHRAMQWHPWSDLRFRDKAYIIYQKNILKLMIVFNYCSKCIIWFQVFIGNSDWNIVVSRRLKEAFIARYIRIHPVTWHSHISLRAEFYGCKQGKGLWVHYALNEKSCFITTFNMEIGKSYFEYYLKRNSTILQFLTSFYGKLLFHLLSNRSKQPWSAVSCKVFCQLFEYILPLIRFWCASSGMYDTSGHEKQRNTRWSHHCYFSQKSILWPWEGKAR